MSTLAQIEARAAAHRLSIFGGFHIGPDTQAQFADGDRTVLLLGPAEPGFWRHVTAQPEFDGRADPLDQWSERVIAALAEEFGGNAYFPFGGPPYQPFQQWALRSGRAWISPVGMLVHDTAGLMVSFRGAIAIPDLLTLPISPARPCDRCDGQPCRIACPVAALGPERYDLKACHGFLDTKDGRDCMGRGCAARRACPISKTYARLPEHSAYHMGQFHK